MRFVTENDAAAELEERLHALFHLVPEVQMKHFDGSRCRIDYVAIARPSIAPAHRFTMIGVEVKVGYGGIGDFCKALKQCIDYRHSYIADARSHHHASQVPPYVFLWPDWTEGRKTYGQNTDYSGSAYAGAVRIAGQFNVGIIRETRIGWWDQPPAGVTTELEFRVSDTPIWRSFSGPCGNKEFGTARRRGAA